MTAIQHIVADLASTECNKSALSALFLSRHNVAMGNGLSTLHHLRAWRKFAGLSQTELAEKVGTSHQVIGYLERGRTALSDEWAWKLAEALDTTPGLLIEYDPKDLPHDVIGDWVRATPIQRRQIAEIIRTIVRPDEATGTHG